MFHLDYPLEDALLDAQIVAGETLITHLARDVIDISGPDCADYLQGQISADIKKLDAGKSTMSFALDPKGRVECLFRLTRLTDDHFLADTEPGHGGALKDSLERFKLRTKADFAPANRQMLAIRGACVGENDRSQAQSQVLETLWPGISSPFTSSQLDGFDVLAEAPAMTASMKAGSSEIAEIASSEHIFEWLRTLYGLPVMGKEIQPGAIPNETGLLDVAVSFEKGCYRGQELVERIDSRAGARRELLRVVSTEPLMAGEPIRDHANEEVGTVVSAVERPQVHPPARTQIRSPVQRDFVKFAYVGFAAVSSNAVDDKSMLFCSDSPDKALFVLPIMPKNPKQTAE